MGDQNIKKHIRKFHRVQLQEDQIIRELIKALDAQQQATQVEEDNGDPTAVNQAGNLICIRTRVQILTPIKICGQCTGPQDTCGTVTNIMALCLIITVESRHTTACTHHNMLKIHEQL